MGVTPAYLTAIHEAGHAVVATLLGLHVSFIRLQSFQDGWTDIESTRPTEDPNGEWERRRGAVAVAGRRAVLHYLGADAAEAEAATSEEHAQDDEEQARELATAVAEKTGRSVEEVLAEFEHVADSILQRPGVREAVEKVAALAIEAGRRQLDGDVVRSTIAETVAAR